MGMNIAIFLQVFKITYSIIFRINFAILQRTSKLNLFPIPMFIAPRESEKYTM